MSDRPGSRPKGRTFSFNFSFGKKPPIDDPRLDEDLLELGRVDPPPLPDGEALRTNTESFTLEFGDGKLRVGRGESLQTEGLAARAGDPDAAREAEMWERLGRIAEGKGAYPDTTRWHARLSLFVWVIVIALPLATLIATIVAGESQETISIMTFGAAIIAAMLRSSIR